MTIEERLQKVERELARAKRRNRRLLAACGLAAGILALAWIVAGAAGRAEAQGGGVPAVIRAGCFEVVDSSGKPRAMLGMGMGKLGLSLTLGDENGKLRAVLGLHDENGKPRAVLDVGKDGPGLGLYDENGKRRAVLGMGKDGPVLGLYDENGKTRADLGVDKDGPGLYLYDASDKPVWKAP